MPIPKLVVTAALMAAQMAMGAMRKIEGPRLDELKVSTAEYGTPIPRFWGKRRFEVPIIWAEKLREKKKKSKGKAGKYAEYKYYGTWAVAICDHEIDAVTRIWMDKRLVFQQVAAGPSSVAYWLGLDGSGVTPIIEGNLTDTKLTRGKNMRIYLGTDTQEPDPRMEAWCEDRYGPDTCPAYRGVSYIVFENIPLEKFGNRVPQISVEAVSAKSDARMYELLTSVAQNRGFAFSPDGQWMAYYSGSGQIEWWDVASRTSIGLTPASGAASGSVPNVSLGTDGTAYYVGTVLTAGTPTYLYQAPPAGVTTATLTDCPTSLLYVTRVIGDTVYTAYLTTAGYLQNATHIVHAQSAREFCINASGETCILFHPTGSSDEFTLSVDGVEHTIVGLTTRAEPGTARLCHVADFNHYFIHSDGNYYIIDDTTFAIKDSGVAPWSDAPRQFPYATPSATSFWDVFDEYSLEDASLIRSEDPTDWHVGFALVGAYDPLNHAIWARGSNSFTISVRYLDRVASAGVTLKTIVDDVSEWCGLTGQDTAALTQVVQGYSVTQGSGKDMIAPLFDIHDVIARPHDFTAQFINRGSAPQATLLTEDFVREGDEARYTVTITQDTDLPRRVSMNYADAGFDQQTNTAESRRPLDAVDSVREVSLDLTTYVSDPDEAQQFADRYLRRQWIRAEGHSLGLTAQLLALEPGDTYNLELDGITRTATCVKTTLSGGAIQTEWERDFPGLTTLGDGTGATMDGRDPEVIIVFSPTKGFVLDIPLLADNDNTANPLLYYGAGKYTSTGSWPGAVVWQSDGDDEYEDWAGVDSSQDATWGYATTALGDANPWLWDKGNSVNINVRSGTLSNATEAEIDADPTVNMAYLGGELLNFTTAFLETDGSYTLSGFKRGRRGTEWATASHAIGEEFVLASDLLHGTIGLSEVGTADIYRVATLGRDPSGSPDIPLTIQGSTLRPYAPARVKWTTDGTDMFGEIIRRTRVGGAWVGGSTIPLSENSEEYEVDIMDGDDVLRTITVTGTNTFTYTAAMISADGNVVGVPPDANVYQLSDAVGRGFALAA